ncbi:porin family protein [Chryseobacterium sp.]|uniref:porin family protein n=1 Tax=Chryseobacterium sp. TaxID=1871047 RepID=UPI00388DC9B3
MNKLILGLALVSGSLAFAQEEPTAVSPINQEKENITFGIKAGGNSSYFSTQQLSAKNQKLGFNAGVFVNIPLSQKFAIQPEVVYNQFGAKSVLSSSEVTTGATTVNTQTDFSTTMNYISVPLMLHMKPAKNFYIEAGPEFSYYLNGKNKGETTVKTTTTGSPATSVVSSTEQDINKDAVNKFNLGLGLGLGYYFVPNLGINVRYINSLTDMRNQKPEGTDPQNHRVFQLGLNYKF